MENDIDTGAMPAASNAFAICALRYCFGRRTYMPSLVIDWLKRHWTKLSLPNQETIHRDIKEAIQSERDLGDMCDVKTWRSFQKWVDGQILKIGDDVKLCTKESRLDAFISGEYEDGRSVGYWLVDCPEKTIIRAVFC